MERRPIYFHSEGEKLAGDLILPAGDGPFPAMVVLMGTGSQNRYGDNFQSGKWSKSETTRLLCSRLADAGIATLCWDKRGVGESTGGDRAPGDPPADRDVHANVWTDVADAESALLFLSRQPEIDPERLSVWGWSAGVYFASLLAARTDLPAAYVLIAGVYRSLPDLVDYLFEWINPCLARVPEAEAWFKEHAPYHLNYAKYWRGYVEAAERGKDVYEPGEGEDKARFPLARLKNELADPPHSHPPNFPHQKTASRSRGYRATNARAWQRPPARISLHPDGPVFRSANRVAACYVVVGRGECEQ